MRTFLALTYALFAVGYMAGCQQNSVPPRSTSPTISQPPSNSSGTAAASTPDKGESAASDATQPDDPGMTSEHDKTIKQEEPSGDESSRAAPNEGDAEPPQ